MPIELRPGAVYLVKGGHILRRRPSDALNPDGWVTIDGSMQPSVSVDDVLMELDHTQLPWLRARLAEEVSRAQTPGEKRHVRSLQGFIATFENPVVAYANKRFGGFYHTSCMDAALYPDSTPIKFKDFKRGPTFTFCKNCGRTITGNP